MPHNKPCAVRVKDGVAFTRIAPAGFRLLAAIEFAAFAQGVELVITSACDGAHNGADDPHHRGEAYDVRSYDLDADEKRLILSLVLHYAADPDEPSAQPAAGVPHGYVTRRFFGQLELAGEPAEHLHFQLRRGQVFP